LDVYSTGDREGKSWIICLEMSNIVMTINRIVEALLVASFVAFTTVGSAIAQPPPPCVTGGAVTTSTAVTTYHYDNLRTGWNCNETILTPAVVNHGGSGGFGLLSTTTLDDQVTAQPLFVPKQTIRAGNNLVAGATPGIYDVVYVATENNSIYAIDASTGKILLHKVPGNGPPAFVGLPVSASNLPVSGSPPKPCGNFINSIGIHSTPVIDLANHAMYLIVYTQQSTLPKPTLSYWLHEIDLATLDLLAPPLLVSASHLLDDKKTTVQFHAESSQQRPALLFIPGAAGSGKLYAGFGSFCDSDNGSTSRGWLLGWQTFPNFVQAKPMAGSQLNNIQIPPGEVSPPSKATIPWSELLSSIWMSGFGMAADAPAGNVYFVTGNSNLGVPTYDPVKNPANSVLKVSSGLTSVPDHFTPSNHNALDAKDMDFGSGGVTLLPDQPGLGATKLHLAVAAGKDGFMYLNDRDSLAVPLDYEYIGSCFCGQSYFHASGAGKDPNGKPYTWKSGHIVSSGGANVMAWQVVTPVSNPFPAYLTQETSAPVQQKDGDGGFFTSISSNGEKDMIIWAVPRPKAPGPVVLYAFQATQVPEWGFLPLNGRTDLAPIFQANAGNWVNPNGNANIVPVVANGRVFVASSGQLNIFGKIP
jgi:hypothetical protein